MNSITIDGVVIPVVKNRPQFGTGRAKARVFVHSVVEAEEELLGKPAMTGWFDSQERLPETFRQKTAAQTAFWK